jgi:glycosyltransferase involved in cell wall biosynthesis
LEIIFINDGSTDGSEEICDEYAKKDPRIIVIHKKNGGLSSARNAGLDIATGDLIAFVDSDDWLGENVYTKIIETYEKTPADIVQFGYFIAYQKKCMRRQKYIFDFDREFSNKEALSMLLEDKYIENYVWNKIYTRKLFEKERFPLGKNFEDIAIMYKLFLKANRVVVLSEYFKYFYFQRKNSIVRKKSFKNAFDCFENRWLRYEDLKNDALIDRQALYISTLSAFINIHTDFPFQYASRAAFFEEKLKIFLAENKSLNEYPLNKSHWLYLRLPFLLFSLLYNDFTRIIMNSLKRAGSDIIRASHRLKNLLLPPPRYYIAIEFGVYISNARILMFKGARMFEKQVVAAHYDFKRYIDKARWNSFYHQIDEILAVQPDSVLEIGAGIPATEIGSYYAKNINNYSRL